MDSIWLVKKVLHFYIPAVVIIDSRGDVRIEAHHRTQPWSYHFTYKPLLSLNNQLYMVLRQSASVIEVGVVYVGVVHVTRLLIEELRNLGYR